MRSSGEGASVTPVAVINTNADPATAPTPTTRRRLTPRSASQKTVATLAPSIPPTDPERRSPATIRAVEATPTSLCDDFGEATATMRAGTHAGAAGAPRLLDR